MDPRKLIGLGSREADALAGQGIRGHGAAGDFLSDCDAKLGLILKVQMYLAQRALECSVAPWYLQEQYAPSLSASVGMSTRADSVGSRGRRVGISLEKSMRADIWLLRWGSIKRVSGAAESGSWRPKARRKPDCGGGPVYRKPASGVFSRSNIYPSGKRWSGVRHLQPERQGFALHTLRK